MRIALIAAGFPTPEKPSSGVFTLRAARGLAERNEVEVFHLRAWRPSRPLLKRSVVEGVPVTTVWLPQLPDPYRAPWRTTLTWRAATAAGWLLLRRRLREFDVLHSAGAAFAGVLTAAWSRRARRPHVAQVIGTDANSILPAVNGRPGISGWERNVDAFVCNSAALAAQVRSLYPDVQDVSVVYRGTDLVSFSPPFTPRAAAPLRVLFTGGFPMYQGAFGRNYKGGETVCTAWSASEEQLVARGATLTLAGPLSAEPAVDAWRRSLKHPEAVTLAGTLPPDAMPDRMRAADVLLVPSMAEGLPNAAIEAAASGCAVLGSRVGGIPEAVVDGITGLLLPPGDPAAWSAALQALADDPESARIMGRRGRAHVEGHFNAATYAAALEGIYERVLAKR
jgi:glycosyltransferase involved in cell wall biosynthesis